MKNYTFKIVDENNRAVHRVSTHGKRRFLREARTIKWKELKSSGGRAYLRVYYGKHKNAFDEKTHFYNDGYYETKKDFWRALKAFDEIDETDF